VRRALDAGVFALLLVEPPYVGVLSDLPAAGTRVAYASDASLDTLLVVAQR
jgi:hypothetical protein